MHKCDTPRCINPDHLELGTAQSNVDDMIAKGRWTGRKRKITPQQSEKMRELHFRGWSHSAIAREFSVSWRTVLNYIGRVGDVARK